MYTDLTFTRHTRSGGFEQETVKYTEDRGRVRSARSIRKTCSKVGNKKNTTTATQVGALEFSQKEKKKKHKKNAEKMVPLHK